MSTPSATTVVPTTTRAAPGNPKEVRAWLEGHRKAATERMTEVLGGDREAAGLVVSHMSRVERAALAGGGAGALSFLRVFIYRHAPVEG